MIKKVYLLMSIISLILIFGCNSDDDPTEENSTTYSIGDIGPGGGFVFQIDSNGIHGKEIAPLTTEFQSQWGCYSTNISGTEKGINTGITNSTIILQYHGNINFYTNPAQCQEFVNPVGVIQSTGDVAAKNCADLIFNEFDDWYLPSIDELELVYLNLHSNELGDINTSILSSSTQNEADFKQFDVFQFSNGTKWGNWKHDLTRHRAIRNF